MAKRRAHRCWGEPMKKHIVGARSAHICKAIRFIEQRVERLSREGVTTREKRRESCVGCGIGVRVGDENLNRTLRGSLTCAEKRSALLGGK